MTGVAICVTRASMFALRRKDRSVWRQRANENSSGRNCAACDPGSEAFPRLHNKRHIRLSCMSASIVIRSCLLSPIFIPLCCSSALFPSFIERLRACISQPPRTKTVVFASPDSVSTIQPSCMNFRALPARPKKEKARIRNRRDHRA